LRVKHSTKFFEYNIGIEIFSKRLKELREEKSVSKEALATALQVSFSVVCYWETDRSEPTAPNLVKIADFFGVSCDYLLGRTPQRYSDITDISDDTSKAKRDAVSQIVNKKLIQNTQTVLYDYLIKIRNRKLSNYVSNYLMLATYNMFRKVYSANEKNPQDMFAVHKDVYDGFSTAAMQVLSTRVACATDLSCESDFIKHSGDFEISPDELAEEYPQLASSVFNLVQHAESNMKFKR
jgi:transcriptional regulator with XRE-family HTH domain